MKFKVGDRVRLVRMEDEGLYYKRYLGQEFEIEAIFNGSNPHCSLKGINRIAPYLKNLELVKKYTYEDLKKSPIGTKITLEKIQDKQLVKTALNRIENDDYRFFIRDFEGLNTGNYGKIIKIEEPTYTTAYEYKPEILDEVEKRYLKGVIRPFRDNVEIIRKLFSPTKGKYYIQIRYKDEPPTNLPYFESKKMYKNMETDKIYTLEELGL